MPDQTWYPLNSRYPGFQKLRRINPPVQQHAIVVMFRIGPLLNNSFPLLRAWWKSNYENTKNDSTNSSTNAPRRGVILLAWEKSTTCEPRRGEMKTFLICIESYPISISKITFFPPLQVPPFAHDLIWQLFYASLLFVPIPEPVPCFTFIAVKLRIFYYTNYWQPSTAKAVIY